MPEDYVERVYVFENSDEIMGEYAQKEVDLKKLKVAKRDTKGNKIRL